MNFKKFLPKKPLSPGEFWQWVEANLDGLQNLENQKLYRQACDLCERAFGEVIFEFQAGEPPTVTLSADGIRERIDAVRRACATVPQTNAFRVVAFRQPADGDFSIQLPDQSLSAHSVRVSLHGTYEDQTLALTLYLPLPADAGKDDFSLLGFLILDHVLGEYVVLTRVGTIEFKHATLAPDKTMTLIELKEHFLADAPTTI